MSCLVWSSEASERLFAEAGFHRLDDFLDCQLGTQVTQARTRSLRRFELGEQTWYLKIQDLRAVQLPIWRMPSYFFKGSPVAREARSLEKLESLGVLVPEIVATAYARGIMPWAAMLLTKALPGYVDLVTYLEGDPDRREAGAVLERARALVLDLHKKGYVLLGSKFRNILVNPGETEAPLAILDQPNLSKSTSPRLRRKDLRLLEFDQIRYADWTQDEPGA